MQPNAKPNYIKLILLYCLLPLIAGALVYFFFRSATFLSSFLGFEKNIPVKNGVLRLLVFTLPDFCWSYSLASALYLFSHFYERSFKLTAVAILMVLLLSELVQLFFPQRFTFDVYDLAAAVLAFIWCTFQMKNTAYETET